MLVLLLAVLVVAVLVNTMAGSICDSFAPVAPSSYPGARKKRQHGMDTELPGRWTWNGVCGRTLHSLIWCNLLIRVGWL